MNSSAVGISSSQPRHRELVPINNENMWTVVATGSTAPAAKGGDDQRAENVRLRVALSEETDRSETFSRNAAALEMRLHGLEAEMTDLRNQGTTMKGGMDDCRRTISRLQRELAEASGARDSYLTQLQQVTADLEESRQMSKSLAGRNEQSFAACAASSSTLHHLETVAEEKERELASVRQRLQEAENALANSRQHYDRLRAETQAEAEAVCLAIDKLVTFGDAPATVEEETRASREGSSRDDSLCGFAADSLTPIDSPAYMGAVSSGTVATNLSVLSCCRAAVHRAMSTVARLRANKIHAELVLSHEKQECAKLGADLRDALQQNVAIMALRTTCEAELARTQSDCARNEREKHDMADKHARFIQHLADALSCVAGEECILELASHLRHDVEMHRERSTCYESTTKELRRQLQEAQHAYDTKLDAEVRRMRAEVENVSRQALEDARRATSGSPSTLQRLASPLTAASTIEQKYASAIAYIGELEMKLKLVQAPERTGAPSSERLGDDSVAAVDTAAHALGTPVRRVSAVSKSDSPNPEEVKRLRRALFLVSHAAVGAYADVKELCQQRVVLIRRLDTAQEALTLLENALQESQADARNLTRARKGAVLFRIAVLAVVAARKLRAVGAARTVYRQYGLTTRFRFPALAGSITPETLVPMSSFDEEAPLPVVVNAVLQQLRPQESGGKGVPLCAKLRDGLSRLLLRRKDIKGEATLFSCYDDERVRARKLLERRNSEPRVGPCAGTQGVRPTLAGRGTGAPQFGLARATDTSPPMAGSWGDSAHVYVPHAYPTLVALSERANPTQRRASAPPNAATPISDTFVAATPFMSTKIRSDQPQLRVTPTAPAYSAEDVDSLHHLSGEVLNVIRALDQRVSGALRRSAAVRTVYTDAIAES